MILKNFIVFEGLDGSGTTTQLKLSQDAHAQAGTLNRIHITCEPTDSPIGKLIRAALSGGNPVEAKTLAYLFGADRNEHIYGKDGIQEHLTAGQAVVSDRYLFSSLAYQGLTAGTELAYRINGAFPLPEYLFFFDVPVSTAIDRIRLRGDPLEVYEKKSFQGNVAEAYNTVLQVYTETAPDMQIIRLNAEEKAEEIHKKIWSIVKNLPKL